MSKKEESEVITLSANLDEIQCPSCHKKPSTLCYAEQMTKEGAIQGYGCINPHCHGKIFAICMIITELDCECED